MSVLRLQPKPVIRRSLAEGLLACSDFEREDGERLAFGIAFHDFVALYWRHLQAIDEESDWTAVRGLAGQAWARTPGLLQSRYDEFMALATRFAETHLGELATLTHVEHTETLDVGDMVLTCTIDRIDRLDGGDPDDEPRWERIWDGKTEQGEMDHAFQVRWYAQMRFLNHPRLERIDFVIDPIRLGRPDEPIVFERGDLDEWWATTQDGLRRRMATPRGNPTGGPKCHECALRASCGRSLAEAREMPETEAEADESLAEHHRIKAAEEVRWAGLREWYRDRDPRVVQGEDVGWMRPLTESAHATAPPRDIVRWAFRAGMDGWAFVKPLVPDNRGLQDQMIVAGLVEMRLGCEAFKTRAHKPLGRKARRKAAELAEAAEEVSRG